MNRTVVGLYLSRVAAMPHPRRFRFGVQAARAGSRDEWIALARRAESLGYDTLFVPDHFSDQLGPVPALMAAADATTTLRVGTLVFANDYYQPAVLAKEVATLDVLSGGRVEFGLGAGWMTSDYDQSGIPLDSPGVRVERFEEAIAVYKGLFGDGPLTHDGAHYRITNLDGLPKPVQRPHPPLLIGAGGRRMIGIAAREADIVGVNPNLKAGVIGADAAADATAAATDRKLEWLRADAGTRFDEIELNTLLFAVQITESRDATQTAAEMIGGLFGLSPAEALEVPHALLGTVDEVCERLEVRRDRWGFSYTVVQADALEAMAPVIGRLAGR
jgi:probable F420-dependent oxidoreductase